MYRCYPLEIRREISLVIRCTEKIEAMIRQTVLVADVERAQRLSVTIVVDTEAAQAFDEILIGSVARVMAPVVAVGFVKTRRTFDQEIDAPSRSVHHLYALPDHDEQLMLLQFLENRIQIGSVAFQFGVGIERCSCEGNKR